jgi:hypothetical protein
MLTDNQFKAKLYLRATIRDTEKEIEKARSESGQITNPKIEALEKQIEILMQSVRLINLDA